MLLRRGGPSRLTWLRFRNLLNELPPESRYHTRLRNSLPADVLAKHTTDHDPSRDRWSKVEMQLAAIEERLQLLLIAVISALGGEAPEFRPNYRPGLPMPEGERPETLEEREIRRAALRAQWDATTKPPPAGG